MKAAIFRTSIFLLALLPGACHYTFTSPALYSHNSSSAFDLWLFMWALVIVAPVVALLVPLEDKQSGDEQ